MALTRPELVDWVQARIDEISPLDQSATIPQLIIERELDEAALQVSRKAKKQLIYPAGSSLANQTCFISMTNDTIPIARSVIVPIPETFLRFLRIRLKNWNMPIDDLVSVDTNMYRHQYNKYQVATTGRPSAAIIPFSIGISKYDAEGGDTVTTQYNQAIEIFPAPISTSDLQIVVRTTPSTLSAPDTLTKAAGDAKGLVTVFGDNFVTGKKALITDFLIVVKTPAENMPDSLIDPIVWLAASRCLTSLRLGDLAQAAAVQHQMSMDQLLVGMKGEEVQVAQGRK